MAFKEELKELGILNGMGANLDDFLAILDTPDEQFDVVYPDFKKNLLKTFESPDVQREIRSVTLNTSHGSREEEQAVIDEILAAIDEIEDLSANKKDMLKTFITASSNATMDIMENPRERIFVEVKLLNENAKLPTYAQPTDAGADIYSAENITINPGKTHLVSTGLSVAIPVGYMIQIYPRSGLSVKTGLRLANSVGIIDSDYRGEIKVAFTNISDEDVSISIGDRIAQMIVAPAPMISWRVVDELNETSRGEGGFGSTGVS